MSRERSLATAFVHLADSLVDDFDTTELLQVLVDQMVDLLAVDAAGLLLADRRGGLRLVATTDHDRAPEIFDLQAASGPGHDTFTTGRPVVNIGLDEARRRWPAFCAATARAGYQTMHALPMRLRGEIVGSLCLLHDAGSLSEDDQVVAQALADVATIALLRERTLRQREILAEELQATLNQRVLVEQAKGVLAERNQESVARSFERMRTLSRETRRPLGEVARAGVADVPLPPA